MSTSPIAVPVTAHDCDLRAAVQQTPEALILGYEFNNRSPKVAFLFNALYRTGSGGGLETSPDYVYAEASGETLLLSKKIHPVPDDIDVERPEVPWCTRVEPGATFREKITIPVPVKLWTPYSTPPRPHAPSAVAFFELGFHLATDPNLAKPYGEHYVLYPFPLKSMLKLRVGPLARVAVVG